MVMMLSWMIMQEGNRLEKLTRLWLIEEEKKLDNMYSDDIINHE